MNRTQLIYALAPYMDPRAYQDIIHFPDDILKMMLQDYKRKERIEYATSRHSSKVKN